MAMMMHVGQSEHGASNPWPYEGSEAQYATLIAAGGLCAVCTKSGTQSTATTKLPRPG